MVVTWWIVAFLRGDMYNAFQIDAANKEAQPQ